LKPQKEQKPGADAMRAPAGTADAERLGKETIMAESRTQKSERGSKANLATRAPSSALGTWSGREPWEEGSPFAFMQRLMSEMDSLFSDFGFGGTALPTQGPRAWASRWLPQVDVTTRDGQLFVHADLPGLKQATSDRRLRDKAPELKQPYEMDRSPTVRLRSAT